MTEQLVGQLLSVNVGAPRAMGTPDAPDPMDRPWTSAIFKSPVAGSVWAGVTNLACDGQADPKNHGGVHKAIHAYSADHVPAWCDELGVPAIENAAFGENFTVAGLTESNVCVGDIFTCGPTRLEVSQPRQPCWKLARKWRVRDLSARVHRTGRTGWYFRVLVEGAVEAGMALSLVDRPWPRWTLAAANELMAHRRDDRATAAELAAVPQLGPYWRSQFLARAAGEKIDDPSAWLFN
jgi:MOSC domain-containing protein YiiM